MSSEKFEDLEDDFKSLRNDLFRKLESAASKFGEDKKSCIREIQRGMDEARSLLGELENESRSAPNPYRLQMGSHIKQYRQDLEQLGKKLASLNASGGAGSSSSMLAATRQELFGFGAREGPSEMGTTNQRARLLQMNETLERTSGSIFRTHQVAAEVDQIGSEVVDELGTQRESLIRTRERLEDIDDNLSTSRKILRSMYRRVITNKLIMIIIIILELGILAGILYYKLS